MENKRFQFSLRHIAVAIIFLSVGLASLRRPVAEFNRQKAAGSGAMYEFCVGFSQPFDPEWQDARKVGGTPGDVYYRSEAGINGFVVGAFASLLLHLASLAVVICGGCHLLGWARASRADA